MNKKIKKRIQVLKERLQNRQLRLTAAIQQPDEPDEAEQVRREIAEIKKELQRLSE